MGIRDRENCNGTTGYFGPSAGQGAYFSVGFQRDYFGVLPNNGAMDYIETSPVFLIIEIQISWQIYTTKPTTLLDGNFNGAMVNF